MPTRASPPGLRSRQRDAERLVLRFEPLEIPLTESQAGFVKSRHKMREAG